jgi:hypothetical protein
MRPGLEGAGGLKPCLKVWKPCGLLLSPSSSIASEVPKRDIDAMFAYARQRMFRF